MPADWVEVADRCWVRRYASLDVSCGVVGGEEGLLVVDTRLSAAQGRQLVTDVRALSALPVRAVVNTHVHFDHVFGNRAVRDSWPGVPIVAHESVPVALPAHEARIKQLYADEPDDPCRDEVLATEVMPPDILLSSVWSLDLGDRLVEVVHPGRGHTDGDVVVRVPAADVAYAGDLVEESGPLCYGPDCWPLQWPQALELLVGLLGDASVVVPGHGDRVGKEFVLQQRLAAADVAGQVQELAAAEVPVDEAAARGRWPYPAERLEHAVRRGYAQLTDLAR